MGETVWPSDFDVSKGDRIMDIPAPYFAHDGHVGPIHIVCPHCGGAHILFQGMTPAYRSVVIVATCYDCRKSMKMTLRVI